MQVDLGPLLSPLRTVQSQANAIGTVLFGAPGFFEPRLPPPQLQPQGTPAALSYYDSAPLRSSLERLVDFDRINAGETRSSASAR